MAITPLFVPQRSEVLESLRLTDHEEVASQQIDDALLEARAGMYEGISPTRVEYLKAVTRSTAPTTTDELARSRAESLEKKMVRRALLKTMPMFFLRGSGDAHQVWNEQPVLREDQSTLASLLNSLEDEIEKELDFLRDQKSAPPNVAVIGPSERNKYPGTDLYC